MLFHYTPKTTFYTVLGHTKQPTNAVDTTTDFKRMSFRSTTLRTMLGVTIIMTEGSARQINLEAPC